jgi:farnesyl-diphosphate farnesyltransferase
MESLKNQTVFNFCAIPQVMAIATLAKCYDNYGIFTGVVKIRKGTAVSLMMKATSMDAVCVMGHASCATSRRFCGWGSGWWFMQRVELLAVTQND